MPKGAAGWRTCTLHGDCKALLQLRAAVFERVALAPQPRCFIVRLARHLAHVVHHHIHRRNQPRIRVFPERLHTPGNF